MYSEKKLLEYQIRKQRSKVLNAEANLLNAEIQVKHNKLKLWEIEGKLETLLETEILKSQS